MDTNIRSIDPDELDTFLSILREAADWLLRAGNCERRSSSPGGLYWGNTVWTNCSCAGWTVNLRER